MCLSSQCRQQRRERPDVHVLVRIDKRSPDITASVHVGNDDLDVGAGGQGINFGYASSQTKDGMFSDTIAVVVAPQWQDPGDALLRLCWQDWSA